MDIKEEIEKILENSKFIEKTEFIEKRKEIISSDPSRIDIEGWKEILSNDKKMGDFWEFMENSQWFSRNLEQIKEMYGGKVVLIYNQEIVFSSEDSNEVINKITSLGLESNQCIVCYIPKPGEGSLLYAGRT